MSKLINIAACIIILFSCQKKEIQFGTSPEDTYTRLINIDTVSVQMSTVILDSFATNGQSTFLLGKYSDPYFGRISAKPYFQIAPPVNLSVPATVFYDSLVLIIPLSEYYYGDTSRPQTVIVKELASTIEHSYGSNLYNTSSVAEKAGALGARTIRISPRRSDSITIRLDDTKGNELFQMIKSNSDTLNNTASFIKYFKGVSLAFSPGDTTAVYGIKANTELKMRLYYHTTIPYFQQGYKDFLLIENNLKFTQLGADRTGMLIPSATNKLLELPSAQTGNISFSQPSLGVLPKATFPSLRNLLYLAKTVRLLKAELVVRPVDNSFNDFFMLPTRLYLSQTNATNYVGNFVAEATPQLETALGSRALYKYDITSFINDLLATPGLSDYGFFIIQDVPGTTSHLNRAVLAGPDHSQFKAQLNLTILTVKE